jgi:hypothetical protein
MTTAVALTALGATAAPSWADHEHGLPSTTVLTSTAAAISGSQSATITATISPGYLVGPPGAVRFSDSTNGAVIGSVPVGLHCLLSSKPCQVDIDLPASVLAPGANTIVGAYNGDLVQGPSSGSVAVFQGTETTCGSGSGTCTASATSSDSSTSTTITSSAPSSGTEQVLISFASQTPPCAKSGIGDTLVFSVTDAGGTKSIQFNLSGSAADQAHAADPDSYGNLCYESPASFKTSTGQPATQGPDGLYYGKLPVCDDGDGDVDTVPGNIVVGENAWPCLIYTNAAADTIATYTPAADGNPSRYSETFKTTASDPKAHF